MKSNQDMRSNQYTSSYQYMPRQQKNDVFGDSILPQEIIYEIKGVSKDESFPGNKALESVKTKGVQKNKRF